MVVDEVLSKSAEDTLLKWLDRGTLIEIIKEIIYEDSTGTKYIPERIANNPERFLLSYFGTDLLYEKTLRKELVLSMVEKESESGLKRLLWRLSEDYNHLSSEEMVEKAIIKKWFRGGPSATIFAEFFGFPIEFAGKKLPEYRLNPIEEVKASEAWFKSHDYQEVLLEKLRDWYEDTNFSTDNSGILVMPTGTGKTRVAVSLIINEFKRIYDTCGEIRHTVLWIAHTKELCEQAIETITRTWIKEGAQDQILNVYRYWENIDSGNLWGANGIIVAGVQKLSSALGDEDDAQVLSNFIKPSLRLIVIDEAHLADNPSYRRILDFFSSNGPFESNYKDNKWKLLGLTATPFKSDESRTRNLNRLFPKKIQLEKTDSNRLQDIDKMSVIEWMQKKGYISDDIIYKIFNSQIEPFSFSEKEIRYYNQFQELHEDVMKRLSINLERNDHIIDRIKWSIGEEQSKKILLFACSVNHCYILNSDLAEQGIRSLFVTGTMSRQERAENISIFKKNPQGEPIVMINYAILTTGFDDPKIDTILISRPTCSRVLYHQMIGRGLRGRNNGGNKNGKCLIIDIQDNFKSFEGFQGIVDFSDKIKEYNIKT